MNSLKDLFLPLAALALLCCFLPSCSSGEKNRGRMQRAEQMMESAPESALKTLDSIHLGALSSKKDKARYALLRSMALDKNAIDTISFEVIQPAVDYYLHQGKGSPDDRLRTLYYQGRIFQNRKEDEDAMRCFIKATDMKEKVSDLRVLACTYGAMRLQYYKQGRYADYIKSSLQAAELCRKIKDKVFQELYLIDALEGTIIMENKSMADSLFKSNHLERVLSFDNLSPMNHVMIIYNSTFGPPATQKRLLDSLATTDPDEDIRMDLADAYANIGLGSEARGYLASVDEKTFNDPLKYLSVEANVLGAKGDYKGAYDALKKYIEVQDSMLSELMSQDLLFLEKKYTLEQATLKEKQKRQYTLACSFFGVMLFLIVIMAIVLRLRATKLKKLEAELKVKSLNEEKRQMEITLEMLELERSGLKKLSDELEENLGEMESQLKEQQNRLDATTERLQLAEKNSLTNEFRQVVKKRLEILNSVILASITHIERHKEESKAMVKDAIDNRREFLESTRKLFTHMEPEFITKMEESGLTEREIHYACLTVLGLNGDEIAAFLDTKRHYHISSKIRTKLGMEPGSTYLKTYLQKFLKSK